MTQNMLFERRIMIWTASAMCVAGIGMAIFGNHGGAMVVLPFALAVQLLATRVGKFSVSKKGTLELEVTSDHMVSGPMEPADEPNANPTVSKPDDAAERKTGSGKR